MSFNFTILDDVPEHLDTTTRSYTYPIDDFINVDPSSTQLPEPYLDINRNRVLCGAPELTMQEIAAVAQELSSIKDEYLELFDTVEKRLSELKERGIEVINSLGAAARQIDERKAFSTHALEFRDQNGNGSAYLSLTKLLKDDIQTHLSNTEYRHGKPVERVQEVPEHTQVDSEIGEAGEYQEQH